MRMVTSVLWPVLSKPPYSVSTVAVQQFKDAVAGLMCQGNLTPTAADPRLRLRRVVPDHAQLLAVDPDRVAVDKAVLVGCPFLAHHAFVQRRVCIGMTRRGDQRGDKDKPEDQLHGTLLLVFELPDFIAV
jgi:hypothetical protein